MFNTNNTLKFDSVAAAVKLISDVDVKNAQDKMRKIGEASASFVAANKMTTKVALTEEEKKDEDDKPLSKGNAFDWKAEKPKTVDASTHDKKKVSTGTVYTKKLKPVEEESDAAKRARLSSEFGARKAKRDAEAAKPKPYRWTDTNSDTGEKRGHSERRVNEESIDEGVTRKHFQQVADLIKTHDDHGKRKELAQHHAAIFQMQNPRFDRQKFMAASNVDENLKEEIQQEGKSAPSKKDREDGTPINPKKDNRKTWKELRNAKRSGEPKEA